MQMRFPSIMTSSLIQWVSRFMYASGNGKKYTRFCAFLSDILYVYGQSIIALLFASAVLSQVVRRLFTRGFAFVFLAFFVFYEVGRIYGDDFCYCCYQRFFFKSNDIYFTVFPLFLARLVQSRGTSEFQVLLVPGIVRR